MVSPLIVEEPPVKGNTRLTPLPLMVSKVEPGPAIGRLVLTSSSPEPSAMVRLFRDESKVMVSPTPAANIACLSDPAPESLAFRTVKMAASMKEALAKKAAAARTKEQDNFGTCLHGEAIGAPIDRFVFVSGG